ncbi:MAG: 50S ribosomal protein L10 [Actinobacteria bacterium]|nr:50S ribosomal protein L10 [Actinomycetota bacterium]
MARPEKVAVVDEIKAKITSSGATVITEYRGLTVPEIARLRAALRDSETSYKIYKNTLARRAVEAADLGELTELLLGPTAWAFVDGDIVTAAKALREFARTNEALVVKGGLLEGQIITAEQVAEIALLPTRDELLAKIAGVFQAPMAKAASLFSAIQRNMAYGLKALIDKRVEAGEELPAEEPPAEADVSAPAGEAADAAEPSPEDSASPEAEAEKGGDEGGAASGPGAAGDSEDDSTPEAAADGPSAEESAEGVSPEAAEGGAEDEEAPADTGQEPEPESE